jgi:chitin synthase
MDLSTLLPISDDMIVSCIHEWFMTDSIYMNINPSALVAINPHKYVSTNSVSVMHKYAAKYRNTSVGKEVLSPYIFQLANHAYYHM